MLHLQDELDLNTWSTWRREGGLAGEWGQMMMSPARNLGSRPREATEDP